MNYRLVEYQGKLIVECDPDAVCLRDEQDSLDLVGACGEAHTPRLLVYAGNLTPDFYDLSSGVAGAILLKFANYRIKVAAVLIPELVGTGKFYEFALETNRGRAFRIYYERSEAAEWLVAE